MDTTYKLQRGGEIQLRPVSQYDVIDVLTVERKRFEQEHGETRCPTFTLKLGGGVLGGAGEEEVPYTEATIATSDSVEDIALWREYKANRALWRSQGFTVTARVLLCDGVVDEPPESGWQDKYIRRGVEIPTDPDELKVFWIERQLVLNPTELLGLVTHIQSLAQAEVLEAAATAAETFRNPLGDEGRPDAEADSGADTTAADVGGEA